MTASRARRSRSTFIGDHLAVVPFQRETPVQQKDGGERTGSYGGGFEPPITHQLAFLGFESGGAAVQQITRARSRSTSRARSRGTARTTRSTSPAWAPTRSLQIQNASQVGIAVGLERRR